MGMPSHVREVGVCGDFLSGADYKVYGVGRKICPVAVFADGFGAQKGKVTREGRDGFFPVDVETRVFKNGNEFGGHSLRFQFKNF